MTIQTHSTARKFIEAFILICGCVTGLSLSAALTNPDFESGLTGWYAKGSSNLTLQTGDVHAGTAAALSSNRSVAWHGPGQNILTDVQSAGPGSFEISLFAKNYGTAADLRAVVRLKYGGTNYYHSLQVNVGTTWTEVAGSLELDWVGTLQEAEFYVAGLNASQSFAIDTSSMELVFTKGDDWFVSPTGNDSNSGTSQASPFQTIQAAVDLAQPGDVINLLAGTYKASDYDTVQTELQSYLSTPYANIPASIGEINPTRELARFTNSGTPDAYITLRAFQGAAVKLSFNGLYGINFVGASYIVIEGLEIEGPSLDISYSMADRNRTLRPRSTAFAGIGVQIRNSHHIIVRDCFIHHTPGAGVRSDDSDYLVYEGNIVSHCNWWTPSGSSAMVVASARSYDNYEGDKIWIRRNVVHSSWNTQVFTLISRDPDDTGYGGAMHGKIEDGQGLYTTRNNGSADLFGIPEGYAFGDFRIENNLVFNNGYGGLTYHKTDRGTIMNNTIIDNGVFPPNAPRSGSNFNNSNDVDYFNNVISYTHGNPSFIFQSSGINVTNNLFHGPSTSQVSGNTYKSYADRLNTFDDPVISFGPAIGDSRMESVFGVGNLPAPAILFSYDFVPKAGGDATDTGIAVGGAYPIDDIDTYSRAFADLDLGAYDSDQSNFANSVDPRYLLRITEPAGYLRFEPFNTGKLPTNLLENTDFETGLNNWSAKGPGTVSAVTGNAYSNNTSLRASSRTSIWNGPMQDITTLGLDAGQGTYRLSGYVKNTSGSSEARLTLRVKANGVNSYFKVVGTVDSNWTLVEGEVPVSWTGTLTEMEFYVANTAATVDFDIDVLSVQRVNRIEAESATLLGSASVGSDVNASGGQMVTGLGGSNGSGLTIASTPAAKNIRIGLTTLSHGTVSIYINGSHFQNIYSSPAVSLSFPGKEILIAGINLDAGDSLSIRKDNWDSDSRIDYVEFEY